MDQPSFSPTTLGRRIAKFVAGDFVLTEAFQRPMSSFPRHAHELACLTFVLKGHCIETFDHKAYECGPVSAIVKPAGEVHANRYGQDGARCLILEIEPKRIQTQSSFSKVFAQPAYLRGDSFTALGTRIYKEFKTADFASALCIEGLVLEVIGQTERSRHKLPNFAAPKWLARARELCHDKFNEALTLSEVAKEVGINPAHLARTFRRHHGCTLGEYVRRLRLDRAAHDITHTLKSFAEIAVEYGFYDQSHLTHAFKVHTGMTPTEFRAAVKSKCE